jgi:uncharacterized membrane protein (DUF4010 family)
MSRLEIDTLTAGTRLAVAALCGLAVGLEREWSGHTMRRVSRFAGLRTLFLLGLLGGASGLTIDAGLAGSGTALLAGGVALIIAGYVAVTREPEADPGGTTESAALVLLGVGVLAGLGELRLAAGTTAIIVLALREKRRLHWLVSRIGEPELRGALQYAVLAFVVLPILPEDPVPWLGGARLRSLWAIVLLFSAINYLGHLARRFAGPERGYGIAGLLGGIVSSTAVTLQFARQSRVEPAMSRSLAVGVIGACTMLLPRVLVVSTALNPSMARLVAPLVVLPIASGISLLFLWRSGGVETHAQGSSLDKDSPLRLWSALQMAVAFQLAIVVLDAASGFWGSGGVFASAAALGLTDVDALTFSMSRYGQDAAVRELAARAIALGVLVNTLFKLGLALVLGSRAFHRVALPGLVLAASLAAGLLIVSG